MSLSAASLDATFPCRLVLDGALTVVHRGPALAGVAVGAPLGELFRLLDPDEPLTFGLLCACAGTEVLLDGPGGLVGGLVVHDAEASLVHVLGRRVGATPVERERAATILLRELGTLRETSAEEALRRILRADAEAMAMARVSYWSLVGMDTIKCEDLFIRGDGAFTRGATLQARDFPSYFAALTAGAVIAAADAHADPRTREFSESYLRPLGIGAMLDVPVFVSGQLAGVLCHEHVGPERDFGAYELQIAVAVAQSIAQVIAAEGRRLAEAAVRASEERFRQLVEVSPVPVLVSRISDGKILYASAEMSRLLGARREDILGARSTDFYADASERAAVLTRLRRDGHLREMELRLRRPDGTVFWSLLSADPIEFDGEPALLSGIVDLSEHKRNEERIRDVMRALADRDFLLTSDLERARAFQDSLLPPALVRDDVTVEVLFRPADEVSGDVYDIEIVDGQFLRLFVADATGHGVSAALTTMFLRSEYDVAAQGERSPGAVLRALNSRMLRFGERILMRFTAICLTVDLATGVVTWATAAHPGPVVLRDGEVIELEGGGTFVGLVEGAEFLEHTAQLRPGDTICAYSDGLTEALDRGGKLLGEARVHAALAAARGAGESLAAAALEAVTGGIGDAQDDVVLLAARWLPAGR